MNWFAELLQRPPVTAWDIVDITIVSIVVYEVLKLIRGTHAVQMAMGIALLVGMFYLSRGFQLETVNWLILNVVGYVVFAAIVLMQSDIRRALVHIGRAPYFRIFRQLVRQVPDADRIKELVGATWALAHTGRSRQASSWPITWWSTTWPASTSSMSMRSRSG